MRSEGILGLVYNKLQSMVRLSGDCLGHVISQIYFSQIYLTQVIENEIPVQLRHLIWVFTRQNPQFFKEHWYTWETCREGKQFLRFFFFGFLYSKSLYSKMKQFAAERVVKHQLKRQKHFWQSSLSYKQIISGSVSTLILLFTTSPAFANSVDADQMASDQNPHCLSCSLWTEWIQYIMYFDWLIVNNGCGYINLFSGIKVKVSAVCLTFTKPITKLLCWQN